MMRFIGFLLVAGLAASNANAVLSARFANVDNTAALTGYVTQDLLINTSAGDDWGQAQLLTTLTAGSIYQDANGSDFAPNPLLFPTFPSLEFDSYLDGNGVQPGIIGAAVNLGGDVREFSDEHIDIAWYNTKQDDVGSEFGIGRFTLSDDAIGTWSMMVASTSGFRTFQGQINNGLFDLREIGPLTGDLDSDGFVGITDLNIVLSDWNKTIFTGDPLQIGEISNDGFVGIEDLNIVLGNWNQFVFPGDTSVGDITGDGFVGIEDLNVVLANWNFQVPVVDLRADPSGDNFIGIEDLNIVLGNWNAGTPPSIGDIVIPEPSTAMLGLLLVGLGSHRRYR